MITPEDVMLNRWNPVQGRNQVRNGLNPPAPDFRSTDPSPVFTRKIRRHASHEKKYYHHDHRISDPCGRNLYCRLHAGQQQYPGHVKYGAGHCHGTGSKPFSPADSRCISRRNTLRNATC